MRAIEFENVRFSYGSEGADEAFSDDFAYGNAFALQGLNFSVEEGEFVAVLGHNGSGKSTLARLTDGLLTPSEGKIRVFGVDVTDPKNVFEARKRVGIVFQNPDNQTVASIVEDDVAFGPENVGVPREEIGERIDFALKAVGMEKYRHATTTRLSGGQKQRVAIAGVLALKPKVMILDEATAMLDPVGRREVMEIVKRLNEEEKITVLLITHFAEEAMLADRAVVMNRGKIVMEGKPFEVLLREKELSSYGLALPYPVRLCRLLAENGLPVADGIEPSAVAENIACALKSASAVRELDIDENRVAISDEESGRVFADGLSYTYNPASPFETHALNGVSLEIKTGEFFGILGQTGSGKSTFVQHLNALIKLPSAEKKYKPNKKNPQTAKLSVAGYDLTDKTTDFRALRRRVGMVFQYPEYQLFAETVFEDVAFGLKNFSESALSESEVEAAVREAIETVGLRFEEVRNRSPFELSGGQKRRVAIAGVIVTKPQILVLDEPAAGLDPLGKKEIMELLHKLHKEWCKTVIVVSHDMDELAENCSRVAAFADGKVFAVGAPEEVFFGETFPSVSGLEKPFLAKLLEELALRGVALHCKLTLSSVAQSVLQYAKTGGAGTRGKGGDGNA